MSPAPPVFTDLPSCENHLKKIFEENNIHPKKTTLQFMWGEFVALIVQVMVFGFAFAMSSNFLEDKKKAVQIFSTKIGGDSMSELWMLGLGILMVIGFLSIVSKGVPAAQTYIDDFVLEIPRAIYAFGASATAACICLALYVRGHSNENLGVSAIEATKLAVGMLLVSFIYGCALSFVFKRHALK
jgi:hypothetical protein